MSGVVQGSVLGPSLFLNFLNAISDDLPSSVQLFADDCALDKTIRSPSNCVSLQDDLDKLFDWCEIWQMHINF